MPAEYRIRRKDKAFLTSPDLPKWSPARRSAHVFTNENDVRKRINQLKLMGHVCGVEIKHIQKPAVKTTREAADMIIKELKAEGFIIQRYNAYSTNSIYLKLNYGYSHSIRISDHDGKAHLAYRYNIIMGSKPGVRSVKHGKTSRNFYSERDIKAMIKSIISTHQEVIKKYGRKNVDSYIQERYDQNKDKQVGFWADAWEV